MPRAGQVRDRLPVFEAIRTRRAVRAFSDVPVSTEHIWHILKAARWAPSAGNRRIHKFVVVQDVKTIQSIRAVAPGILGNPRALIVICTDREKAAQEGVRMELDSTTLIDVGTTAQTMLLAAHELGLGGCPVTSFSRSGVAVLLNLPGTLVPEFMVQLGHPVPQPRVMRPGASLRLRVEDLTYWERYPERREEGASGKSRSG